MALPTLVEVYDTDVIKHLRNITHDQYAAMRDKCNDVSLKGEKTDLKREVKAIRKICREALKNNFKRTISYKFGNGRSSGRVYANNASLQNIPRFIRGALCYSNSIDIDAINAHPRLLQSICAQNGIGCPELTYYNGAREACLETFSDDDDLDRSQAKQLFLVSINSEKKITKLGRKNIKNPFYIRFDKEMKYLQRALREKYPDIFEDIQNTNPQNHAGKMMAWILNVEEGKMLHRAVEFLENRYKINCLAFDGLMVDKLDTNNEASKPTEIIEELNKLTADINISWAVKNHDLSMMEDIRSLSYEDNDNLVIYGTNEMEIVNQIFDHRLKGRYYRWNSIYYLRDEHIWRTHEKDIKQIIAEIVNKTDGLRERRDVNGNITYENITQSLTGSEKIQAKLFHMAERSEEFLINLEKRCDGKITFANGYIDFNLTRPTFVPFTKHNKDYDTIYQINRDFEYISPHDPRRIELMNKIFKPMFCVEHDYGDDWDTLENFLHCLARAIAGIITDKRFTMINGERDSCKSAFGDLMNSALGNYVQIFSASSFRLLKEEGDESKRLGMFLKHRHCRVLLSQEIGENWLDGVLLKKLSSGGDAVNARMLYHDDETFVPRFKLYFFGNEDPRVKPQDCMKKCWKYTMRCKFVDKMPEKPMVTLKYYPADHKIKNYCQNDDTGMAFVSMLMDYFARTDTVKPITEMIEESTDPSVRIYEIFEFTGNDNDRITNAELRSMYDMGEKMYFDSFNHLTKIAKGYGALLYKSNGIRGLKRIKRIISDEEESCDDI